MMAAGFSGAMGLGALMDKDAAGFTRWIGNTALESLTDASFVCRPPDFHHFGCAGHTKAHAVRLSDLCALNSGRDAAYEKDFDPIQHSMRLYFDTMNLYGVFV